MSIVISLKCCSRAPQASSSLQQFFEFTEHFCHSLANFYSSSVLRLYFSFFLVSNSFTSLASFSHIFNMAFNVKNNLALLVAAGVLPFANAAVPTIDGFTLTWSDDFVGTANSLPNTADWTPMTGTSYPGGAANWGTNEIETVS